MSNVMPMTHEENMNRELARFSLAFAREYGGCTERCRFEAAVSFDMEKLVTLVMLLHNGRDREWVEIPRISGRESTLDVLRVAAPWLRGLHRFPVEMGIK